MHELPVTESILKIAIDASGGRRITRVNLVIGELASIVDDSVQFYFDLLSRGTLAEGASLHFDRRAAQATCNACGHVFESKIPLLQACPVCSSGQIAVTGGREMRVDSIEVSDVDDGDTGREEDPERKR